MEVTGSWKLEVEVIGSWKFEIWNLEFKIWNLKFKIEIKKIIFFLE